MISTQYIKLNMIPKGVLPVLYCSQYDVGRPLGVIVYNDHQPVDLDSYTVTVEGTRKDKTPVTANVTTSDNIGAFTTTATMTNKDGSYKMNLIIVDGSGNNVASIPFVLAVVKRAMDENSESIEEDRSLYQQYTGTVQGLIATINANLAAEIANRQARDNTLQSSINSEASTRAAADSLLQSEIDQLVAPSGEAPSAAEVQNARIGADGVTYPTLGDAIRTNDANLKSQIGNIDNSYYSIEDISAFYSGAAIGDNVSVGETVSLTPSVNVNYAYQVVECTTGERFVVTASGSSSYRAWALIDSDNKLVSKSGNGAVSNAVVQATTDGKLIVNADTRNDNPYSIKRYKPLREDVEELTAVVEDEQTQVDAIKSAILVSVNKLIKRDALVYAVGFYRPNGTYSDSSTYCHTDYIYIKGCKKLRITGKFGSSVSPAVFFDSSKNYISGFAADQGSSVLYTYEIDVPSNAYYVISSYTVTNMDNYVCDAYFEVGAKTADRCYMSPTGLDENDGLTESTPIKTAIRAKEILADYGTLILTKGDYNFASAYFDFDYFHNVLGIDHPRILCYDEKIASAELETGYTRVYKAAKQSPYPAQDSKCLYQHDVPDASTEIPVSETHPLNRNKLYRLPSTRLIHASSIAEIESTTDQYMWYYDSGYYYFSCPEPDQLSDYPIYVPISADFWYKTTDVADISFRNFAILYNCLSVDRCAGILDNVEIGMCAGPAGLSCDYCESMLVRNCSIYAVSGSSGGDGINIHNEYTTIGRRSLVTIENCWLHDNSDDGESCHADSDSIHYGSLVEYNGTGITPAGGGSVCHDVIARHQGAHPWVVDTDVCAGFSCQGDGSTLVCHNCVSEQNVRGYSALESTASEQTAMTLINSISRNNTNAELYVSRCEIDTYDVTIINSDGAKHISTVNSGTVNVRGIDRGYDSSGVYINTADGKNYIIT